MKAKKESQQVDQLDLAMIVMNQDHFCVSGSFTTNLLVSRGGQLPSGEPDVRTEYASQAVEVKLFAPKATAA